MIQKNVEFYNEKEQLLSGVLRVPDEEGTYPAVIICHDFRENKDREFLFNLATAVSSARFVTLRFDFIHHGESHGSIENITMSQQIKDVTDAINFLGTIPQVDKSRIYAIGHGLGADVLFLASGEEKRLNGIISLGARRSMDEFVRSKFSEHQVNEMWEKGFVTMHDLTTINKDFVHDAGTHDIIEMVENLKVPLLILHGMNDKMSPFQDAREIFNHATCQKTLDILEDADHNFTDPKQRKYIFEVIVNWLLRNSR